MQRPMKTVYGILLPLALLPQLACGIVPDESDSQGYIWKSRGNYTSGSGKVVDVTRAEVREGYTDIYKGTWTGPQDNIIELECYVSQPLYLRRDGQTILTAQIKDDGRYTDKRAVIRKRHVSTVREEYTVFSVEDGFNNFDTINISEKGCRDIVAHIYKYEREQAELEAEKSRPAREEAARQRDLNTASLKP